MASTFAAHGTADSLSNSRHQDTDPRDCSQIDEFGNEDLSRRVSIYLNSRHFDSFKELDVDVVDGAVTISGKLDSYYQKQVAINSCQRVAGVVSLIDQITVLK